MDAIQHRHEAMRRAQRAPRRGWMNAVIASLLLIGGLAAGPAAAKQTCKYDSIAATAPASRFTDNGDGTVTDKATGLQWKRCSEGQEWNGATCTGSAARHTWQQALQRADTATYAGKSDWRLPNIKELASIVEQACDWPSIDLGAFPATQTRDYWSSSPNARNCQRSSNNPHPWSLNFPHPPFRGG